MVTENSLVKSFWKIAVVGTPETVAEHPTSHAGRFLKQVLQQHPPEILVV